MLSALQKRTVQIIREKPGLSGPELKVLGARSSLRNLETRKLIRYTHDGWYSTEPQLNMKELEVALKKEYPVLSEETAEFQEFLESRWKECQHWAQHTVAPSEYYKDRYCCKLARAIPCVCSYSYFCPVHGECHVGTHD